MIKKWSVKIESDKEIFIDIKKLRELFGDKSKIKNIEFKQEIITDSW